MQGYQNVKTSFPTLCLLNLEILWQSCSFRNSCDTGQRFVGE
jgi:hypothetical protein